MAEDARRLLDHLGIPQALVIGYSMGARIAAFLTINHPERVRAAVFAGLAENMIKGVGGSEPIAQALEATSAESITDPGARVFRLFAEQTKSDLRALAACMRSEREKITRAELAEINVPILVVAGDLDEIAGAVEPLVEAIPGAQGVVLPRRNHMNAVGDRQHKEAVVKFFSSIG
jgi:pimeloyl-ACP methyl ester carboxylesterase